MNLNRVTITGADDNTVIADMERLSAKYPFVEWGILVSQQREGNPRFPSREWIIHLCAQAPERNLQLSTHICGRWVRQLLEGGLNWHALPSCVQVSERIQINTHGHPHRLYREGCVASLRAVSDKQIIFQWDGVNDGLIAEVSRIAPALELDVAVLFDTSGGAGILPASWPQPVPGLSCGYAGGLGPDNVVAQVMQLEKLCHQPYWIDMERRVRNVDDVTLNMILVERVLEQVADLLDE